MLLEKGVDVNAKNRYRETALHKASMYGHTEIVAMLMEKGADVNTKDRDDYTALYEASNNGHTETVAKLLEQEGIEINTKDINNGYTALKREVKMDTQKQWQCYGCRS